MSKKLIATLFTAAGCAEIPARIFNGWLADRGVMSAMNQLALCMTITGICALICAIVSSTPGNKISALLILVHVHRLLIDIYVLQFTHKLIEFMSLPDLNSTL